MVFLRENSDVATKKRIAISQRYDQVPGRDEWRNALDAKWIELLESIGFLPILLPSHLSDVGGYLRDLAIDGLILSGGNDIGTALPRDYIETEALAYADEKNIPVLGICRGMQFLCKSKGGNLQPCEGHVARYHKLQGEWAQENGFIEVNSYHNKAIFKDSIPACFDILATTVDDVVEACRHKEKPWLGIMWHPEREYPFRHVDFTLIKHHFYNR